MKKELIEKMKVVLEKITEDYGIRNEYGMSYDHYYYEYEQTEDENDVVWLSRNLLDDIEDYEDLRENKLKRILNETEN